MQNIPRCDNIDSETTSSSQNLHQPTHSMLCCAISWRSIGVNISHDTRFEYQTSVVAGILPSHIVHGELRSVHHSEQIRLQNSQCWFMWLVSVFWTGLVVIIPGSESWNLKGSCVIPSKNSSEPETPAFATTISILVVGDLVTAALNAAS